jgi:hypothetical protein
MKLAEALMIRADAQKRIQQLRERLARSAKIQEGETPPENPQDLLDELQRTLGQFTSMVKRINRTNAATEFESGKTLTDALAERDALSLEVSVLTGLITAATVQSQQFAFAAQVKMLRSVNVADIQKRVDDLSKTHRELDARIQALNWTIDLVE